jgi:hypothetical protein
MRYWSGVLTGIAVSAIAFLIALTNWLVPKLVDQIGQLTADDVPRATSMVTGSGWAVAAPTALVLLLLAASIVPRRRETVRLVALILVAVACAAVIGFTVMGINVGLSGASLELRAG